MARCPLSKQECLKENCEWWLILSAGKDKQGRCVIAWGSIILIELRKEVETLRIALERTF